MGRPRARKTFADRLRHYLDGYKVWELRALNRRGLEDLPATDAAAVRLILDGLGRGRRALYARMIVFDRVDGKCRQSMERHDTSGVELAIAFFDRVQEVDECPR